MGLHKIISDIGTGTEKLYYKDAYLAEFTAEVVSCNECAPGLYDLVLDRTAFFPEEGGQSPDSGSVISNIQAGEDSGNVTETLLAEVTDVQIIDGVIHHYVNQNFDAGIEVRGRLDFDRRFSNMQQHSAEHIFSGLVNKLFGYYNVGFHLSDNEVTMDYSGPLSTEDIRNIETKVNEAIYADIESIQLFPEAGELENLDFRSKKEIKGQVRLIEFPGYDICACCAPHVRRTGEIGILKVISAVNYKGGTRLSILAGKRALDHLREYYDITVGTARDMTCGVPELRERVRGIAEENFNLKGKLAEAQIKILKKEIENIPGDLADVCVFTQDTDRPNLRKAVNDLVRDHDGICGIFSGNDEDGYIYVIAGKVNVIPFHKLLKSRLDAKGGGQPVMVQGSVSAKRSEIEELFNEKQ